MLTACRLREVLHYDPETGRFTWLVQLGSVSAGARAGRKGKSSRLRIRIDGELHYTNRLAWLYMTGAWPEGDVDHKDTDHLNDRWANLRDVPHFTNNQNLKRAHKDSKSGLLGVAPAGKRWRAYISPENSKAKQIHLGTFACKHEAHAVYVEAKRRMHAGCTI